MARNEEKAQSMLYRFREAQAAELGLGTRADRRPKMASACKSLRECERWRGEILREISRKVSKIQDAGMTDYEVRDLNDEINKLLREKRHWENQIISLGGANYRRNVAMLDDDGKEVPGTKGYKYFGRAKDLPGVRELFQSRKKDEEEETLAAGFYKKFTNQGPSYFGDLDETDPNVLDGEEAAEMDVWNEGLEMMAEQHGLRFSGPPPSRPVSFHKVAPANTGTSHTTSKRKAAEDGEEPPDMQTEAAKRSKLASEEGDHSMETTTTTVSHPGVHVAASHIPFLAPTDLEPPKMPSRSEMEQALLELRKKALVNEYFGDQ